MRIHFSSTQPIIAGDVIELVITHCYMPTLTIRIKVPEDWVALPEVKWSGSINQGQTH